MSFFIVKYLPFLLVKEGLGNALNPEQFNQLYDARWLKSKIMKESNEKNYLTMQWCLSQWVLTEDQGSWAFALRQWEV